MSQPEQEQVTAALARVSDPTFDKPMLEVGTLSDVRLDGRTVTMTASLSSPVEGVRATVRQRVEDVLLPLGMEKVEIDFRIAVPTREVAGDDPVPDVKNVILVMSGKGGVGKSTVSVNLSIALSRMGTRVGLMDADIYGPSIPTMMGVDGRPRSNDGQRIEPLERFGIKLMSIGFMLEDPRAAVVWRGPMLHSALSQFLADVAWGELDYLVVDLPPGTGDVALTIAQKLKVTGALIVTTPQEVALQDVYKGVSMCQRLNLPVLGVIENMSWFVDPAGIRHELFGAGGGQKVADFAKAPLLAQIPIEPRVRQCGDEGTPVVEADAGTPAAVAFSAAAEKLAGRIALEHFERGGGKRVPSETPHKRLRILR